MLHCPYPILQLILTPQQIMDYEVALQLDPLLGDYRWVAGTFPELSAPRRTVKPAIPPPPPRPGIFARHARNQGKDVNIEKPDA